MAAGKRGVKVSENCLLGKFEVVLDDGAVKLFCERCPDLSVAVHLGFNILGEVGLGGEIRPVSQSERRLAEASKMGMTSAFMAERGVPKRTPNGIQVVGVRTIHDLFQRLFA